MPKVNTSQNTRRAATLAVFLLFAVAALTLPFASPALATTTHSGETTFSAGTPTHLLSDGGAALPAAYQQESSPSRGMDSKSKRRTLITSGNGSSSSSQDTTPSPALNPSTSLATDVHAEASVATSPSSTVVYSSKASRTRGQPETDQLSQSDTGSAAQPAYILRSHDENRSPKSGRTA